MDCNRECMDYFVQFLEVIEMFQIIFRHGCVPVLKLDKIYTFELFL